MKNIAAVGIPFILVLLTSLFIAGTIVTALFDSAAPLDTTNADKYVQDALNEISTYTQVKQIAGYYSNTTREARLTKLALLISPFFSEPLDINMITIQIQSHQDIYIYTFNTEVDTLKGHGVFTHPLWSDTYESSSFSCIIINDKDHSIQNHYTMNHQTDMAYLILSIPQHITIQKGSIFTIALYPGTGIQRTFFIEAPLPTRNLVCLYP